MLDGLTVPTRAAAGNWRNLSLALDHGLEDLGDAVLTERNLLRPRARVLDERNVGPSIALPSLAIIGRKPNRRAAAAETATNVKPSSLFGQKNRSGAAGSERPDFARKIVAIRGRRLSSHVDGPLARMCSSIRTREGRRE